MVLLAVGMNYVIVTNNLQTLEPSSLGLRRTFGRWHHGRKKKTLDLDITSLFLAVLDETNRLLWDIDKEMFLQAREPELIDEDERLEDMSAIPGSGGMECRQSEVGILDVSRPGICMRHLFCFLLWYRIVRRIVSVRVVPSKPPLSVQDLVGVLCTSAGVVHGSGIGYRYIVTSQLSICSVIRKQRL